MTASSVSRALRRGGLLPVPSDREGIHVTGRNSVYVRLDFDSALDVARAHDAVDTILVAAGYTVRVVGVRVLSIERKA